MEYIEDPCNPGLSVGQQILNYRIEKIEALKEISAVYYALTHLETGAPHVHISRSDKENTLRARYW